jgi:S-DNA-T family DNA segregation ATPase FtsK/SpoIIIE
MMIKQKAWLEQFGMPMTISLTGKSYKYPTLDLLENYGSNKISVNSEELEANKNKIVETLNHYNIEIDKIKATIGPTVTLYEIIPAPGVRISKIKNLEDDIALSLAAWASVSLRQCRAKGTIGIEVPNQILRWFPCALYYQLKNSRIHHGFAYRLGKTISNEVFIADLAKMPHLLVAGATGQGKSVGINAILVSLLYKKHPAELNLYWSTLKR